MILTCNEVNEVDFAVFSPSPHCSRQLRSSFFFFLLGAAWVKSGAERPSVSGELATACASRCELRIKNHTNELTKQARRSKLRIGTRR